MVWTVYLLLSGIFLDLNVSGVSLENRQRLSKNKKTHTVCVDCVGRISTYSTVSVQLVFSNFQKILLLFPLSILRGLACF